MKRNEYEKKYYLKPKRNGTMVWTEEIRKELSYFFARNVAREYEKKKQHVTSAERSLIGAKDQ